MVVKKELKHFFSTKALGRYDSKDITLRLPLNITMRDVDWFSVYCIAFRHNFSHINIPNRAMLKIPVDKGQLPIKAGRQRSAR